jgi:hypothetical protein
MDINPLKQHTEPLRGVVPATGPFAIVRVATNLDDGAHLLQSQTHR